MLYKILCPNNGSQSFCGGEFDLKNATWLWRLTEVNDFIIKALVMSNPHYTTWEIEDTKHSSSI